MFHFLLDQQQADGGDGATVIETGRDAQRNVANAVEAEQEREDLEEAVAAATEDIEAEEVEEPVTKAPAPSRAINRVKTVTKVRTNAGFTPASTNLFSAANPGVFRAVAAVPNVRHEFVAAGPHLSNVDHWLTLWLATYPVASIRTQDSELPMTFKWGLRQFCLGPIKSRIKLRSSRHEAIIY